MRLRYKMIILLILAAVLPLLAVFISISAYAGRQRESLVNMKLNSVYGGAVGSYERMGKSILSQVGQLSEDQTLLRYLLIKGETGFIDQQGLIDMAVDMRRLLDLDYLFIIAPDGSTLARGHDPALFGDNLSSDPVFAEALKGQKVQSLARINDQGEDMLAVMALAPVWYENRELIGIVAGGNYLDEEFCRNLRDLSGAEILLLEGNTLLAKTIPGNPGEMSLYMPGTGPSGQDKQTFRTKLQGIWYTFSRYALNDYSGNRVADLLYNFRSLRWKEVVSVKGDDAAKYGLDAPVLEVTLYKADGKELGSLRVGKKEADKVYVRTGGSPAIFALDPKQLGDLPKIPDDLQG